MKPELEKGQEQGPLISFWAVAKGVVVGIIAYLGLALVMTLVINFYVNFELQLPLSAFVAQYLAVFVAATAAGMLADRSGWVHGLSAGFIFTLIISFTAALLLPNAPTFAQTLLWRILPGLVLGLSGGAVGANL